MDKGSVTNIGRASGTSPSGTTVTATSTVTIPATRTPSIALVKSASTLRFAAAGTSITYSYKVTNTGNVTLHSVDVTDPLPGLSAIDLPGVDPRTGRVGNVHRHVHHHPSRRRPRQHHEHRDGYGHPADRPDGDCQSTVTIPLSQSPVDRTAEVSQHPRASRRPAPSSRTATR